MGNVTRLYAAGIKSLGTSSCPPKAPPERVLHLGGEIPPDLHQSVDQGLREGDLGEGRRIAIGGVEDVPTPTMSLVSPHCDVIDELPVLSRLKNAARVLTRLHTGIEGFTLESLWCISGIIEKIAMHLNIKDDEAHRLA